jgi:hypothetical protein
MINSFTTSNYTNLKGYIAELICEYHFNKLNYNVIPLGNEKISGLLPSIKTLFNEGIVEDGTYDSNTFSVLQDLTQHLPDFAIWKLAHNQDFHSKRISTKNILKISFVEVKYRKEIKSNIYEIGPSKKEDELSLYKYLSFIKKKAAERNLNISILDFYVYLITFDKVNNQHKILFGKVFENQNSENSYKLVLYDKMNEDFNKKTGNKWDDYNNLLEFLMLDSSIKIDYLFNKHFILSLKNKSEFEVKKVVFEKLDEFL